MRHYKIVAYRRAEVSKMLVLGATQDQMAKTLGCSQGVISTDVAYLDASAAEELKSHIERKLPHTHLICARGIDQVIRTAWGIVGSAKNDYQKIHALNLIHQCYITKQNLATDGTIINAAIEMVKKSKKELEHIKNEDHQQSFVDEAAQALTANLQALTINNRRKPSSTSSNATTSMSFAEYDGSPLEEGAIIIASSSSVTADNDTEAEKNGEEKGRDSLSDNSLPITEPTIVTTTTTTEQSLEPSDQQAQPQDVTASETVEQEQTTQQEQEEELA
jgi:hypothetical protein